MRVIRENLTGYAFLLPGLVLFAAWWVYPICKAFQISLYDWDFATGLGSRFVGLTNYGKALDDSVFWTALKNTVLYAAVTVPGQLLLGLLAAVALDQVTRGRVLFRTLYYLPVVTSWVVVSLLFKYLFNSSASGLVNYLFVDVLKVARAPVAWLTNASTAFVAIYALGIWKGVGWVMVIVLAALQSIPPEYREAAEVDGAGAWQVLRGIVLPLLRPTLLLVLVLLTIGAFQIYVQVALITGGGPVHSTEVLLSYMYYQAFTRLDFGYGSSLSYILVALVFGISRLQLRLSRLQQEAGL